MLDNEKLLEIIASWSFWSRPPPPTIPRDISSDIVLTPDLVTVIQGVRRCGKSTLLQQIMVRNKIPPGNAIFINFEDPRLVQMLDHRLLQQVFDLVATKMGRGPLTFFLDEIQNVANWQKWLNTMLEQKSGHTFVVTGSNSRLLGGELATSLTGRHLATELYPFHLSEFTKMVVKGKLTTYLERGGFPAVLKFPQPDKLLHQYFQDIIERDVRERVSAKSSRTLLSIAQMIMESVGSELSLRRIAGATGSSPETVNHYLQAFEDAYLLFGCPFFAFSEAKRTRHNRKYYTIDTGLRRAVSTKIGQDLGKDFENLTFLTLRQKVREIYYWKGKGEVDFIVNSTSGIIPVQVTYGKPQERHHQALQEFYTHFPQALEAIFVTPDSFEAFAAMDLA